jgi:hypothetical protein
MYLVTETIPGAGESRHIPPVVERMEWLTVNATASFKCWWGGPGDTSHAALVSDEHNISFESEIDATAYTLKWGKKSWT